jgi:hypothetical protein
MPSETTPLDLARVVALLLHAGEDGAAEVAEVDVEADELAGAGHVEHGDDRPDPDVERRDGVDTDLLLDRCCHMDLRRAAPSAPPDGTSGRIGRGGAGSLVTARARRGPSSRRASPSARLCCHANG